MCSAVPASVERDIAIIDTRAPRLPEALPNPITGDRRIDLYAFPIDPASQPTILTAISSPSHAPPHLDQLPTHTTQPQNHVRNHMFACLQGFDSLLPIIDGHMVM